MKFIHVSDLHLGAEPEIGRPWAGARKNEIWSTAEQIVSDCNEQEADFLFIAGDLFHKQPLVKDLKTINEIFGRLKNTKVLLVTGANDYMSPRSHYRNFKWNDNVIMFGTGELNEAYFYGSRTTVYGISSETNDSEPIDKEDIAPKKSAGMHILLYHPLSLKHLDYDKFDEAGFDYVALGGEHSARKVTDRVYFSGSPEPLSKDETGDHGYILGEFTEVGGKNTLKTTFVPIAKRNYVDLHIRVSVDDTNGSVKDLVTNEILKKGSKNLYRVYLDGLRNPEISFDTKMIYDIGVITDVIDNTVLDYNYEELLAENSDNLIGAYMNALRDSDAEESVKNRALYYGIEALLKASGK